MSVYCANKCRKIGRDRSRRAVPGYLEGSSGKCWEGLCQSRLKAVLPSLEKRGTARLASSCSY